MSFLDNIPLNILAFSDIHFTDKYDQSNFISHLDKFNLDEINLIVYCGNLSKDNKISNTIISLFNELHKIFVKKQQYGGIFIILGNNDSNASVYNHFNDNKPTIQFNSTIILHADNSNYLNISPDRIEGQNAYTLRFINEPYYRVFSRKKIVFSSYSQNTYTESNTHGINRLNHDKLIKLIQNADIVITHGTFLDMNNYKNKMYIFGYHPVLDLSLYYFRYKDNLYINTLITYYDSTFKYPPENRNVFPSIITINNNIDLSKNNDTELATCKDTITGNKYDYLMFFEPKNMPTADVIAVYNNEGKKMN